MQKFELVVLPKKGNDVIGLNDLAVFLSNFQQVYDLAYKYTYTSGYKDVSADHLSLKGFKRALKNRDKKLFVRSEIDIDELGFSAVTTNSPLKFIGYCTGTSLLALSLAVAVAGGEADLKNNTFKVESLADAGIKIYEAVSNESKKDRPEKSNNKPGPSM